MPELEHQHGPQEGSVERGHVIRMETKEALDRPSAEQGRDTRGPTQQGVAREIGEVPVVTEPSPRRDAEAVLPLAERRRGQEPGECSLEEIRGLEGWDLVT